MNNISQDSCYQIQLSTAHAVYYGVLTIHESNAPFPFKRHQFRMMYDKDILQLFFEDPKKSVFPENQPQLHRMSQEEWTKLRESVPYVKL